MLVLGSRLDKTPVMSLQTGTRLAHTVTPLIDSSNLKIVAYQIDGPLLTEHPSFVRTADIRGNDELIGLHDVIKVEELHRSGFKLIGLMVIDEDKRKLGKVNDYTLDTTDFMIQQLDIKHGILKGLATTGSLVHRSQIIEINDKSIIVKSTKKKLADPIMKTVKHDYVNPFRTPAPEAEPEA
jgi:hypothetical protein